MVNNGTQIYKNELINQQILVKNKDYFYDYKVALML